jgi:hypothetical protein
MCEGKCLSREAPFLKEHTFVANSCQRVAALILPISNERENFPLLVADVRAVPMAIPIIVADGNLPDGTRALADELAQQHPGVEVIQASARDSRSAKRPSFSPTAVSASRKFHRTQSTARCGLWRDWACAA